ncbi:MAG: DNA-deoxyinosine glycosylase [Lysobacterales bacterium]|jgi:hypoxanthine-DNA glycosylase
MTQSQGFPPVSAPDAQLLILGSMPGVASLKATQYYAFPRNAFWRIMGELFDAGPELDYPARLDRLLLNRVALWDVIAACQRPGSLDSSIAVDGLVTNDFARFFDHHPAITRVAFNGQTAARLFRKMVRPGLALELEYLTLPSTSPAHAALDYAAKLEAWSVLKMGSE